MKKLIITEHKPSETILLDSVTDRLYFGIQHKETKEKGLVAREDYERFGHPEYNYRALCSQSITRGNSWDTFEHPDFDLFMTGLSSTFDIFVFDTPRKLFAWLGENS